LFARNLYNFLSAFWDKEAAKPVLPDDDEIVKALRVAPALELPNGAVLRFDGARTADSSSFAEPPTALLAGRHKRIHGHLRASVCAKAEKVCRAVMLDL